MRDISSSPSFLPRCMVAISSLPRNLVNKENREGLLQEESDWIAMEVELRDEDGGQQQLVRVVHSQVRRIKEEDEKVRVNETYQHQVSEMRLVLRDLARQQPRSRSPLGRVASPAISIGGDS